MIWRRTESPANPSLAQDLLLTAIFGNARARSLLAYRHGFASELVELRVSDVDLRTPLY
jgi:hypothetical protein